MAYQFSGGNASHSADSPQFTRIKMLNVLNSGAIGSGGVDTGAVDPTTAPSSGEGTYYNTATGTYWVWDSAALAWVQLIV